MRTGPGEAGARRFEDGFPIMDFLTAAQGRRAPSHEASHWGDPGFQRG